MSQFFSLTTLAFLAALLCAADPPRATPILGIGIVSADQKLVFLPAKEGGIEAVDLATGKIAWTNKDAARLAGASDELVLAWVGDPKKPNTFRVVAMDAVSGKTVGKSDPIVLSDWAVTEGAYGRSFRTAAKVDGTGAVVVWEAGVFYAGGAAPSPKVEAAARKNESGMATVDFKSGKVTPAKGTPKEDDFKAGPAGGGTNKVGPYEFQVTEEMPGFGSGAARVTKVTLVVAQDKKELWKRELAGNPWLPPRR
jgi:hypothetical protein